MRVVCFARFGSPLLRIVSSFAAHCLVHKSAFAGLLCGATLYPISVWPPFNRSRCALCLQRRTTTRAGPGRLRSASTFASGPRWGAVRVQPAWCLLPPAVGRRMRKRAAFNRLEFGFALAPSPQPHVTRQPRLRHVSPAQLFWSSALPC